jgi:hypothetical protein
MTEKTLKAEYLTVFVYDRINVGSWLLLGYGAKRRDQDIEGAAISTAKDGVASARLCPAIHAR